MQRDEPLYDALEVDAADEPTELVGSLDVERPRRITPALKKAIAYRRDRRFVAQDPHLERRSWPKRKALRHQQYRRGVDRAIRPALGTVTPEIDDFAPALPRRKKSHLAFRHGSLPLGKWVDRKLEKRISFVGRNIGAKIERQRYRRRLVPFLESLIAGRRGHAVELAWSFAAILNGLTYTGRRPIAYYDLPDHLFGWSPPWHYALKTLFAEQPEWEDRLRNWIAETAGHAPATAEPAWQRIRRLKGRRTR
jgi:hypothetical protein